MVWNNGLSPGTAPALPSLSQPCQRLAAQTSPWHPPVLSPPGSYRILPVLFHSTSEIWMPVEAMISSNYISSTLSSHTFLSHQIVQNAAAKASLWHFTCTTSPSTPFYLIHLTIHRTGLVFSFAPTCAFSLISL